ncbi:uroplakin-2 isoform X2 [Tachysurus fulvidraco]|nr:uroplakin-2 isoform X2 [Tachysurus fulvidraco]
MLVVLLIIGGLIPLIHAEDFPPSLLSIKDKVITGQFFDSLMLKLPSCFYAGQNVDLEYMNCDTNQSNIQSNVFTVPSCGSMSDPKGSTVLSRNIGYQLMNLKNGTRYKITYKIGNLSSSSVIATTRTVANYNEINLSFQGRSAAMLVITVLLSVAMFILLISIITSVFVSPSEQ